MCGAYTGEHEVKMFQAEIALDYDDNSQSSKVIYAHSLEQVMDDATVFVKTMVDVYGKRLVKHRVIGGECGVQI